MPNPLLIVISVALVLLNFGYWALVVTRGERRFRAWVMQRFDVVVTTGFRGSWRAVGTGSKLRLIAVEMLQLVYFLSAFVVWAVLIVISIGVVGLVRR